MRWIAGGIAGWLAAVAPLLGVNIAGFANIFDTETAVIAGAVALAGGILLGGLVAALFAGRPSATQAGGASGALPAGIVAALLYVASLIGVVVVATRTEAAPAVVADHPLRITGAIICLGAILLGMSLLFGMFVGRRGYRGGQAAPQAQAPTRYQPQPQQPSQRPLSHEQPRYRANLAPSAPGAYPGGYRDSDAQANSTGYGHHGNQRDVGGQRNSHDSYDERQPAPQRSGPSQRHPSGPTGRQDGRSAGRDNGWREDRR